MTHLQTNKMRFSDKDRNKDIPSRKKIEYGGLELWENIGCALDKSPSSHKKDVRSKELSKSTIKNAESRKSEKLKKPESDQKETEYGGLELWENIGCALDKSPSSHKKDVRCKELSKSTIKKAESRKSEKLKKPESDQKETEKFFSFEDEITVKQGLTDLAEKKKSETEEKHDNELKLIMLTIIEKEYCISYEKLYSATCLMMKENVMTSHLANLLIKLEEDQLIKKIEHNKTIYFLSKSDAKEKTLLENNKQKEPLFSRVKRFFIRHRDLQDNTQTSQHVMESESFDTSNGTSSSEQLTDRNVTEKVVIQIYKVPKVLIYMSVIALLFSIVSNGFDIYDIFMSGGVHTVKQYIDKWSWKWHDERNINF